MILGGCSSPQTLEKSCLIIDQNVDQSRKIVANIEKEQEARDYYQFQSQYYAAERQCYLEFSDNADDRDRCDEYERERTKVLLDDYIVSEMSSSWSRPKNMSAQKARDWEEHRIQAFDAYKRAKSKAHSIMLFQLSDALTIQIEAREAGWCV